MSVLVMNSKTKNTQCKRCLGKFKEKEIYTIQQFQYRKSPPYQWTREFFDILEIGEWDSFCEPCMNYYKKISHDIWMKYCNSI
jgi:hypothetical protein